ncbi:HMA2 domain-containing protein [Azospirillum sp. TSO22-1]|uniref:HMA2 domain-containing protein n=1 Tax=Azospirillum sp. TSO22-1 TaxID=716789 RepID=UPI000D608008|nr:hypothetical protein [Azospirillum sp. TSO22-1]PWC44238.1 hypothetical protein TSO221_18250 [Azospirillum sp. TSO22-1]
MSAHTSAIVSAVPGRIRLRHPTLRRSDHHRDVADRLAAVDGLRVAESNPAVGSLLVLYDPAALDPAEAEARVAAVAGLDPGAAPAATPASAMRPMASRINRAAKIGMLGSMAATLAALTVGRRAHAGAGMLFVALMLVHIVNHRRRLFQ